jgi:hypothetical protein
MLRARTDSGSRRAAAETDTDGDLGLQNQLALSSSLDSRHRGLVAGGANFARRA